MRYVAAAIGVLILAESAKAQVAPRPDSARAPVQLPAVESRADRLERLLFEATANVAAMSISGRDLTSTPRLFGEADVLRAVRALPGVNARNDYSVGMNVRGGEADQNLVLLDGHPIYNPFHMGGLFGAFVEPMVGRVEFMTGAFPARYGGRLSSVLDVRSRVEEREGVHGSLGVSFIATTLALGSSLQQGRGTWSVAGRRTYADKFADLYRKGSLPYHFSDLQGYLAVELPARLRLELTGYHNRDHLLVGENESDDERFQLGWGNRLLGARVSRTWRDRPRFFWWAADSVTFEQRVSRSTFDLSMDAFNGFISLTNGVTDYSASGALGWHTPKHARTVGWDIAGQDYRYLSNFDLIIYPADTVTMRNRTAGLWLDDVWRPNARWVLEWGVRMDAGSALSGLLIQPRMSAKRFITPNLAVSAAYGEYAQWAHTLAREDIPVRALDFWVGSDRRAPVSRARHYVLGVERWLRRERALRIEVWLKQYPSLVERNPFSDPRDAGDEFVHLRGHSYGADVMLRQFESGRHSGWLAYTFAYSSRTGPEGRFFPGQDRRHELTLVGNRTGRRYTLSGRFNLATGTPYTAVVGEFWRPEYDPVSHKYTGGERQFIVGERNAERLPLSQRLDVSVTRVGRKGGVSISPYLSVMNVYSAKNVFAYLHDLSDRPPKRIGIPQIPVFPTLGVSIAW